jgi:hypothetical protein
VRRRDAGGEARTAALRRKYAISRYRLGFGPGLDGEKEGDAGNLIRVKRGGGGGRRRRPAARSGGGGSVRVERPREKRGRGKRRATVHPHHLAVLRGHLIAGKRRRTGETTAARGEDGGGGCGG